MKTITLKTKKVFFTLLLILITMIGYSQTTLPFLQSGNGLPANSWLCPAGVTSIDVTAFGAGGGGGRGGTSNRQGGGGGGGGAFNSATSVAVTPGNTYVITVGTGGAGGTSVTLNGNDGSTTTSVIFDFVTITANGGFGGKSFSNGFAGGLSGGVALTGTGGNGSNSSGSGGGGGCAGATGNGGNGNIPSGGTSGGTNAGVGGDGTIGNGNNGLNGNNYGAGGGGGTKNSNGGNGADGYLTITIPAPSNNDCSGATSLTVNSTTSCTTSTTGTTLYASQSQAGCAGTADDDVWYRFTATSTTHTVTVTPGTLNNVVFQIFDGSCAGLTGLVCRNITNGSAVETSTIAGLTIGTTYFVRVYSQANGSGQGTFDICVTTPQPEINIQGNATTIVDGNTTPTTGDFTDFGSSIIGVGFTRTFTIQNTGTASMTIGAITFSGTNASEFTVTTAPSASVAAGGSTTFVVTFNPTAAGIRTATISIVNDDSNENPYDFALQGTGVARPSNNDCAGATSLTVNSTTVCTTSTTGTTINATQSQAGCNGTADDDVWYQFTATSTAHTVTVTPGTLSNAVFEFFNGTCAGLGSLLCRNSTSGSAVETSIVTGLTIGTTYFVRVYSFPNGSGQGTFDICITTPQPEINLQGNATSIVDGDTTPTTGDFTDFGSTIVGVGFTRTFTIQNTGTASMTIGAITFSGTNASEFTVTTAPSASVAAGGSTTFVVTFNPTAAGLRTATISIINDDSDENPYDFALQGTGLARPSNNDCAGATSLTVNTTTVCTTSTSGTTINASQSQSGCAGVSDDDVWYQFTATSTSHTVTVTPTTLSDAVFQVFSGSCAGLTSLLCRDITAGNSVETSTLTGLTIGTAYFVRVYSFANGSGQGTFDICVTTPQPEINLQGNATSIVDGDTTPTTGDFTDFGSTGTGVGITRTFTIQNTGTVSMTIGAITFSGTNASEFTVTTAPSASVAAGGNTTFVVTFTPSAIGTRTATISIVNNDSDENPYDFALQGTGTPPPSNDDCSGATSLTVNATTTCTISTSGTTISATQSQTGCAGTADDDVWYQFTATSTKHIITVTPTTLSDAVFQVFSGSCGSLTSLGCINATTGSSIETTTLTGLTSGSTYYVRVYSNASGSGQGTFSICVTTPPTVANDECSGAIDVTINPTIVCTVNTTGTTVNSSQSFTGCSGTADDDVWYSFVATDAGHTITVRPTAIGGLVDTVFQVYSGNCTSLTSLACINASVGASVELTTVNSLTIGATYYVRVYSSANGSGQGAFTICITSPCIQGNGTSTKACVGVVAGGLGLNGLDPAAINSCTTSTCTNLEATYLQLGNTSTYTVQSIPYVPPYQYACLRNSVSVDVDDVWSQPVSMPFNFCYYGNNYNNFIISSNGAISFDTVSNTPGGFSQWSFGTNVPSATLFLNTIFGVYHDIDPSINGEIGWELVSLNGGCRAMVISWADVPMYSCNSIIYSGMVVLYENTNIIEVYVKNKPVCSTWNAGNAVIGVQNATGTIGTVAPNRNSLDPDWTTSNEAWRFLPSGASITTVTWYEGSGITGPVVGNTATINVCPTTTTTYTAKVEYALCNGGTLTLTDPTTITITPVIPTITSTAPGSRNLAGTVVLGATTSVGTISWYAASSGGSALGTGTSFTTPSIAVSTTYYVESVSGTCTSTRVPVLATVIYPDTDSDGITNNIDLDDDNDGISDTLEGIVDTDADGIINSLDLDSDNDGIGDIIEDRMSAFSNGKDTMDLTLWTDANTNGWDDIAETYYATNSPANFDGDAKANYLDLDSDNDAVFDVDEAGLLNGDGDINCDGKGDGLDTDGDGILNAFDTLVGFGNTGKTLPTNTLGSGNPDYLKVSSLTAGVFDITTTLFASLDSNNNGIIDGTTDIDADGILDAFDTNTAFFGSPRDLNRKLFLDFDGRNDYGEGTAILGGLSTATVMAWINLNSGFSTEGVIVGQNKFHLKVNSARKLEIFMNSSTVTCTTVTLNTAQWYHVAASIGGGFLKLYINGKVELSIVVASSISADASLLTLGKDPSSSTKYFKGKIDEVRVFNVALTAAQLQQMVYQEIQNTGSQVRGTIVPKDISSLPYANLLRNYRMDAYKNDIIDDLTTPSIDVTGMKIYNNKVIKVQQAPMPFVTERTGDFATAVNSPTNEVRGMDIMEQDWSIVNVNHNITETSNNVDLGMTVNSGVTVSMTNDNKLQNDWYLKLDGKLDLVNKSQLVQTINSDLDVTSAGSIEKDQKGQSSKYNYNYWSSPVGDISNISNNNSYTVDSVMKDGSTTTPQNINWIAGNDAVNTTPITLSNHWIFKFQNLTSDYANWAAVGSTGTLLAAQGYTMKGSDSENPTQNYTFVGKPNNGAIVTPIAANNSNLSGNPYPSAIDANAFITANLGAITGTLYFWEHFSTNASHVTAEYQGGYATRNLVGGVAPVSPAGISGLGSSARTPKQYIPVGQGFFIRGNATGGNVTFDNSQRLFIKEDNASSNVLFRQNDGSETNFLTNAEDAIPVETPYAKIRLGFNSVSNFHRQMLLGFMNEHATAGLDPGYDSKQIDNMPSDMYFMTGGEKLAIQGDGFFNTSNVYPIGIKNGVVGNVKFTLDGTENFDENQTIYIYDNVTDLYHNIRNEAFEINLPIGIVLDRFSLRFANAALATNNFNLSDGVIVYFTNNDNKINIKNNLLDTTVTKVSLFNMLGQSISTWSVENYDQKSIHIPVKEISTGTYIIKVQTTNGDISKKIIIN